MTIWKSVKLVGRDIQNEHDTCNVCDTSNVCDTKDVSETKNACETFDGETLLRLELEWMWCW